MNGLAMGRWCSVPGGMMAVVMVIAVSHGKTPWSPHQSSSLGDGAVSSTSVEPQFRSSGENTLEFSAESQIVFSAGFSPNSSWEEEIWEAGVVMTSKCVDGSFPSDAMARNATMICHWLPQRNWSSERAEVVLLPWEWQG